MVYHIRNTGCAQKRWSFWAGDLAVCPTSFYAILGTQFSSGEKLGDITQTAWPNFRVPSPHPMYAGHNIQLSIFEFHKSKDLVPNFRPEVHMRQKQVDFRLGFLPDYLCKLWTRRPKYKSGPESQVGASCHMDTVTDWQWALSSPTLQQTS